MHEGAVCREIVDIVTEAAAVNDITMVYEIVVSVGEYSCVNESQLNFYFDIMKKNTCMEKSYIRLEKDMSITGSTQMYVKTLRGE